MGLYRIDQADLEKMRQEQYGGAKTPDEEKLLAVQEYLKLELKLDTRTVGQTCSDAISHTLVLFYIHLKWFKPITCLARVPLVTKQK